MILANVRSPDTTRGDLRAQIAAASLGERRVAELLDRYGREAVEVAWEAILDQGEAPANTALRALAIDLFRGSPCLSTAQYIQGEARAALAHAERSDLVIANYVDWSPERNFYCGDRGLGMRSYCHPDDFNPLPPTLFHNNGDGTFTDVSKTSGLGLKAGNGLGVVTFDYDNDGWQDIFIANDHMPNFLFHNNRNGTFTEVGYLVGVAVSGDGQFEAGMGCDAADTTGTGRMDLVVTSGPSTSVRVRAER